MAPTNHNDDIIPRSISTDVMNAVGGDHKKIAGLWAFMKKEGYAEQARLARASLKPGIVSRAAAKYLSDPTKTARAQEVARA